MTNYHQATSATFRLAAARDYLHQRFAEPISIAELAAFAGMTRWNFVRAYRRTFGLTPHKEVIDLRVRLAQHLLLDRALPVEDVAVAAGFGSRTAMYRSFMHRVGSSPQQWRSARPGMRRPVEATASPAAVAEVARA